MTIKLHSIRKAFVALWLTVFCYGLTFYVVLSAMSAYQVHERARTLSGDASVNAAMLINRAIQIADLEQQERQLQEELNDVDRQIQKKITETEPVDEAFYWGLLDPIVRNAGINTLELFSPEDYRSLYDDITTELAESDSVAFDSALSEFESAADADQQPTEADSVLDGLTRHYAARSRELNATVARLSKYDDEEIGQAREILVEVRSLRPVFHLFVTQSETVLVFLLIIAMGALGSTIHITQQFLQGDRNHPLLWYLLRPLLGTVTAVAIYILAKAGQLAIDPGMSTEAMSPWFVSFLAIISGLLSERAIVRISEAGTAFFEKGDVERIPRYALGLGEKLAEPEIDTLKLSQALGVTKEELDSWGAGTEEVSADAQKIIAAWLRVPLRELFSDIAPATPGASSNTT